MQRLLLLLVVLLIGGLHCAKPTKPLGQLIGDGAKQLKENDIEEALATFKSGTIAYPKSADVWYYYGNANFFSGHINQAVTAYRKAIRQGFTQHRVHFRLGNALMQMNKIQEARAAYKTGIKELAKNEIPHIPCPNECSGHGFCERDGDCLCDVGYGSDDCSMMQDQDSPFPEMGVGGTHNVTGGWKRPLKVRWEGSLTHIYSFDNVNRHLVKRLSKVKGIELEIALNEELPGEPLTGTENDEIQALLKAHSRILDDVDVIVRHFWPPNLQPPAENARWAWIQPWEYGSIPIVWDHAVRHHIDEVWVPATFVKKMFTNDGLNRVEVVPNGVDTKVFNTEVTPTFWQDQPKKFRFLFVGGLLSRKGVDLVLKAFSNEFTDKDNVELILKELGSRSFYQDTTMLDMVRGYQAKPGPAIKLIDDLMTLDTLASLYRSADCLVHPYRGEGFGLPIAEAMAIGLPVIVPEIGASADFATNITSYQVHTNIVKMEHLVENPPKYLSVPYMVEPDLADLRAKMRHVYKNQDEAKSRGEAASKWIAANFAWENSVNTLLQRLNVMRGKPVHRHTPIEVFKQFSPDV